MCQTSLSKVNKTKISLKIYAWQRHKWDKVSCRFLRGGIPPYRGRSCQKITAPAAATLRESTPWYMGIRAT